MPSRLPAARAHVLRPRAPANILLIHGTNARLTSDSVYNTTGHNAGRVAPMRAADTSVRTGPLPHSHSQTTATANVPLRHLPLELPTFGLQSLPLSFWR